MPTPKAGYYLADGKTRIPGVTTVIGRFKESGGLVHWAWKLGTEGKDYREVRDSAADSGTMTHAAVEAWRHKQPFKFEGAEEVCNKAKKAYEAFLEWASQSNLTVTDTELRLVSEKHKFGGTLDAILLGDRRAIGDWKASNRIYPEYLIQIAAYGRLYEENFPDQKIDGGFHLLRFDKEFGDFHHHYWSELDSAWKAFLHLRALYDIDKELKQRAA